MENPLPADEPPVPDEGFSDPLIPVQESAPTCRHADVDDEAPTSPTDAPVAAAPLPQPPAPVAPSDCGSSSEGYATSHGSLTSSSSSSSATISPANEADAEVTEAAAAAAAAASAVQLDSLTLALEELRSEKEAAAAATAATAADPDSSKPRPQKPRQDRRQQHQHLHQRSSSMKSQKTPPDTPNQMKKVVRFADAFGLDLAYVKHVFDTEMPPVIPPQATRDLNLPTGGQGQFPVFSSRFHPDGAAAAAAAAGQAPPQPHLHRLHQQQQQLAARLFVSPCFAQPGSCANFVPRVLTQKVVLERATVDYPGNRIHCLVRVANLSFEKSVLARVTFDAWRSAADVQAEYVQNSSGGSTDQFEFAIPLPASFTAGSRVVFCVRYCTGGETFWDNNFGDNYTFDCFAVNSNPAPEPGAIGWTHFL